MNSTQMNIDRSAYAIIRPGNMPTTTSEIFKQILKIECVTFNTN